MVSIKDVAERAGVAPSTVSYVLSGSRRISEETSSAVREAIAHLGYHPRASARSLRSSRSDVLVLAVPREPGTYRAMDGRFAIEISDAARAHGYDVLMMTDRNGVAGLRRVAGSGLADTAVLMAVEEQDPRIAAMAERSFPTALLGHGDESGMPSVDLDWRAAMSLAVRRTADAGHQHVLFLASADHEIDARRGYALRGLDGAGHAAQRTGADVRVQPSAAEPEELAHRVRHALTTDPRPTAMVVQHLVLLPRVLDAVASLGLRVPQDLDVVLVGSLPDDPVAVPLPRIELPTGEMSRAVVRLAVEAIDTPQPAWDAPETLIAPRFADGPALTAP